MLLRTIPTVSGETFYTLCVNETSFLCTCLVTLGLNKDLGHLSVTWEVKDIEPKEGHRETREKKNQAYNPRTIFRNPNAPKNSIARRILKYLDYFLITVIVHYWVTQRLQSKMYTQTPSLHRNRKSPTHVLLYGFFK